MSQPSLDQLLWSIGIQESGNNYHVVNSIGAVGKYQVMKANIPSWSKAALGYSISWQKFRDSPDLQEKIVRHRMQGYYNKYGFRGAASAWYSGNPKLDQSTRPQNGGPSIKGYVDSVWNRALGAPANIKSNLGVQSTSGSTSGGTVTVPKLSRAELAEQYGYTEAFLKANPEIGGLFNAMVKEGWNQAKFTAKLKNTKWWKTKSEKERQYLMQRYTDPASAKQSLAQARVKVDQLANQLGMRHSKNYNTMANAWAYNMVAKGWDEGQLRFEIGKKIDLSGGVHQGEAGEAWDKLHSIAYSMGVQMSNQWYADSSRAIVRGVATEQDYEDKLKNLAKSNFPQWSKQIDGGQSVLDIAAPYLQSMSTLLELPAGSINLFDPTIKKTLSYTNPKTMTKEAKPLWQFENELRSDPRWKKTKNAQDSLMTVAHQVLADFGLKY